MRHRNPYRGFTLIEVLVVVGIVLVLLIGAAVFFAGRAVGGGLTAARHSARELKCSTQVRATIQSMVDVGATALAIEADKTLLVEREEMLALAEANNITIAAL